MWMIHYIQTSLTNKNSPYNNIIRAYLHKIDNRTVVNTYTGPGYSLWDSSREVITASLLGDMND